MYDPTKTYPNVGEYGNSSLESVEMTLDKAGDIKGARFRITISPTLEEVRELIRLMPRAFDSVDPVHEFGT